jgi:hypothetical protein
MVDVFSKIKWVSEFQSLAKVKSKIKGAWHRRAAEGFREYQWETPSGARAWKGHDWNVLDRLHAKGYVSDPRSKAKSVVVTEEGVKPSRALFAKYFRKENH